MSTVNSSEPDDELRPEYDLRELLKGGVQGKYVTRYHAGTNLAETDLSDTDAHGSHGFNLRLSATSVSQTFPRIVRRSLGNTVVSRR